MIDVKGLRDIRRAAVHGELARWIAGDRHTNNDLRGRHI